jgi:hypothetical protein
MLDSANTLDITQASNPPFFQEYRDKGRTTFVEGEKSAPQGTHFHVLTQPSFRRDASQTTLESERDVETIAFDEAPSFSAPTQLDLTSSHRSTLLVMKYEGASSKENQARIDILTQRLRKLSPRVTESDINHLDGAISSIESVSETVDALNRKYGMK